MVTLEMEQSEMDKDSSGTARAVAVALGALPPLTAWLVGSPVAIAVPAALIFAVLALLSKSLAPKARPILVSLALVGQCIAFTAAFAGHPWQIDSHMMFFAALAIAATMGSIPALLFGVVLTAVHHLALGFFLPTLVYPSADTLGNLLRTLMHAAIVVLEASILVWSMMLSARAAAEVRARRLELAETAEKAADARAEAEAARERAMAAADRTRREGQRAATAVEEIAVTSQSTAEGAAQARQAASRARHDAEGSGDIVRQATAAMSRIEESSRQIGQIVGVIDEIARQTDLLALNAAVESARAGEAGRGFAVVATEVRQLAQRSAEATRQIREIVSSSSGQVREGVQLVTDTGVALSKISAVVSDLDDLVSSIAASALQQSEGLAEVKAAICRIDQMADADQPGEGTSIRNARKVRPRALAAA
ncbi:methyl-accepting chemotaxis protein [Rhodobacter sp. NSM]|uniref:methyl-accepting chemotaxis protein n=1 Tax=Rhodobacter sp. NSM TaxID=3457501 RepID=UPI003FD0E232